MEILNKAIDAVRNDETTRVRLAFITILFIGVNLMCYFLIDWDGEDKTANNTIENPENIERLPTDTRLLDTIKENYQNRGLVEKDPPLNTGNNEKMTAYEKQMMEYMKNREAEANKRKTSKPVRNKRTSNTTQPARSSRQVTRTEPKRNQEPENDGFDDFFNSSPEEDTPEAELKTDKFIYAVVHKDQVIEQGERVKLRLTKQATILGKIYKRNSYVYATPSFQKNRVLLSIRTINHIPVRISAYDTEDSGEGLYVKGANFGGEVVDEATRDAIDDVDVGGIEVGTTIKNVFRRKQQVQTVTLLNDTKLILKPDEE